jgi:hypothetical protein
LPSSRWLTRALRDRPTTQGWEIPDGQESPNFSSQRLQFFLGGIVSTNPQQQVAQVPSAATDFIKLLFEPGDLLCFAFQNVETRKWIQSFVAYEKSFLPETMASITRANEAGNNVYIAMNTYQTSSRKEADIAAIRTVWAELDENGRANLDKIFASKNVPDPTVVNESSQNKFHAIWKVKDLSVEGAKILLKSICAEFNGDKNAIDAARVLRLPGFKNCKYADQPEVEVVHLSENTSAHAASEFALVPKKATVTPIDAASTVSRSEEQKAILIANIFAKGQTIQAGNRNSGLTRIAGALHNVGLSLSELEEQLSLYNEKFVEPPLDSSEVHTIAGSINKKPVVDPVTSLVAGKIPGEAMAQKVQPVAQEFVIDTSESAFRPAFPYHVMKGTTLYEGLVKPVVENSSKHAELVFMPAVQMMLNYLFNRVRIEMQDTNLNLYVGIVTPPGKFFKSSSCTVSHDFFKLMGFSVKDSKSLPAADCRVVVTQVGSSEGMGRRMSTLNAKNAILFYDELGKLVAKAGIENASLPHDLLSWYESADFGNTVTSEKNSFAFESKSYCFGWQWCTTTRGFNHHWPKIAGVVSGLEDRMFFVVSPEKPKNASIYHLPSLEEAAKKTQAVIEAALLKGVYQFESFEEVEKLVSGMNPRTMQMLFTLSLYFAIDLQKEKIDSDCLKRAKALTDFRDQGLLFLAPIEADNEQGRLQQEIMRELRQNKGKMPYRELCQELHAGRVGTDRWKYSYRGLVEEKYIADFKEKTASGRTSHMVALLVLED